MFLKTMCNQTDATTMSLRNDWLLLQTGYLDSLEKSKQLHNKKKKKKKQQQQQQQQTKKQMQIIPTELQQNLNQEPCG